MELCDESLTAFLEQSPGPLSYRIQVNICHNIALALVYLHSNGLIHRDLTGNNVLMVAGHRAKITDFGMSKLASVNPRMTALTLCPGNVLYMSPEALDEAKSYTAKLDIFSFGVIVIQILTGQFPDPADRFRILHIPVVNKEVRVLVSDSERREAHLKLITNTHFLKPLALQCIAEKANKRPSSVQLSERLSELKQSSQYTASKVQSSSEVEQLKLQLQGQRILTDSKAKEAEVHKARIAELEEIVAYKDRQIQSKDRENQEQIYSKDRQLQEKQQILEKSERELQQSEQLVCEFQNCLQLKENTIADLQQTISTQEGNMQQLQQHGIRGEQPQEQRVSTMVSAAQDSISKMKWKKGADAPEAMIRGVAVVQGNTAYIRPGGRSHKVYTYQNNHREEKWGELPDNPNTNFGLAIIDGLFVSVGGRNRGPTSILLGLKEEGQRKRWSEVFPPMPTARADVACATAEDYLIVAGGDEGELFFVQAVDRVEVMNINTKQWTKVCCLPQKMSDLSATVCKDKLYLAGGSTAFLTQSKSAFTCRLPYLLLSTALTSATSLWEEICSLPVKRSTVDRFTGKLL